MNKFITIYFLFAWSSVFAQRTTLPNTATQSPSNKNLYNANGQVITGRLVVNDSCWFNGDQSLFDGNVGIGTVSPDFNLHVAGSFFAEKTVGGRTVHMVIDTFAGFTQILYEFTSGDTSNVMGVTPGDAFMRANTDGTDYDVIMNISDPGGVKIQGKSNTGNALTIFEGDTIAFGGDTLYRFGNNGTMQVYGMAGAGTRYVTANAAGVLGTDAGMQLGFTTDANNNMYAGSDLPLLGASTNILAIGMQTGDSLANCEGCILLGNYANTYNTDVVTQYPIAIGINAIGGDNSVAIGSSSLALSGAVGIGFGALAQDNSVAIGQAQASQGGTAIGTGSAANSLYSIAINGITELTDTACIAIGGYTNANYQLVFGNADSYAIREVYFGGINGNTTLDVNLQSSGGTGTNVAGGSFSISGSKPTGNSSTGGYISIKTPDAGASGTTPQSLTEKARFTKGGDFVLGIQSDTVGLVLKSPNGHYWRGTISNIGVVTWTDIGTSIP